MPRIPVTDRCARVLNTHMMSHARITSYTWFLGADCLHGVSELYTICIIPRPNGTLETKGQEQLKMQADRGGDHVLPRPQSTSHLTSGKLPWFRPLWMNRFRHRVTSLQQLRSDGGTPGTNKRKAGSMEAHTSHLQLESSVNRKLGMIMPIFVLQVLRME